MSIEIAKIKEPAAVRTYSTPDTASSRISGKTLLILIGVAALLKVGQEIFVPLALSLLLAFTLAPIVAFLRRRHVPKIASVILAVVSAFCVIAVFSFVVATQVANLAENIPSYQRNIVAKVHSLAQAGAGNGVLDQLSKTVERVGAEIQTNAKDSQGNATPLPSARDPMPVEIVTKSNPVQTLGNLILPLISPFATAGLVIVLVIFMLIEREDLRDRFIRLIGLGDLHRTTSALKDAGKRVGKYLLMQLLVNTLYAVPIALGLWILGIPNAILWGMLTLVLRFVPYIGPLVGMILPLFLALAIDPGWSLVIWVGALYLLTELVSNNVIEPWLYGSHTGLSALAIIISAIFWSWLWGPIGLMLSTPLTVCLVVLGRYVPQFAFLDVLLGNEPVLEPHEKLYQRLLAGDPDEATDNAEQLLQTEDLVAYYDNVGLPALRLGELDRQRGVMTEAQIALFATTSLTLIENLADVAVEDAEDDDTASAATTTADPSTLPDGQGSSVLCVGGRGKIDDAASAMLAQVLGLQGAKVVTASHFDLALRSLPIQGFDTVVIAFLNGNSKAHARQIVRRLKRSNASLRVGILAPSANGQEYAQMEISDLGADFVAHTLAQSALDALSDSAAVNLITLPRKAVRVRRVLPSPETA